MKGKPFARSSYIAEHKAGHAEKRSSGKKSSGEETGYWVAGTRVSLDSVVRVFKEGRSPETIAAECFPTLSLEQVYGAIAYYLGHREEIDAYLSKAESVYERQRSRHEDPEFARQLREARRQGHPAGRTSLGETTGETSAQS